MPLKHVICRILIFAAAFGGIDLADAASKPSFDCSTARKNFERMTCGDAKLAELDTRLNRAYAAAIASLPLDDAAALKADQRLFNQENDLAIDEASQRPWIKRPEMDESPEDAIAELRLRFRERLAMLENLDVGRKDFAGLWMSHDTTIVVTPAKGAGATNPATVGIAGRKFSVGDYHSHCDFGASDDFPVEDGKIALDGKHWAERKGERLAILPEATANDPAEDQPDFCFRMRSPAAMLFPVKPNKVINGDDDRLR